MNDWSESADTYNRGAIEACATTVRTWIHGFSAEADVLQIGFEGGAIPQSIIDAGLRLHLVEASRTRLMIFRQMFAEVPSACSEAAGCTFFSRTFDGVLFCASTRNMPPALAVVQLARIERLLRAGGRLLLIIPPENQTLIDLRSGPMANRSAREAFEKDLRILGLHILPRLLDQSGNEYICAVKHVQAGVPH